jgi:hypothetical protein
MIKDFEETKNELLAALASNGLTVSSTATRPLSRIDFSKLVTVYDHEEDFLRTVFISSLLSAYRARTEDPDEPREVNARDVKTAMLMLGAAVASASEQTFSQSNKLLIVEICPYCGPSNGS